MNIWDTVYPYFDSTENWGDISRINPLLPFVLCRIREQVQWSFHVNNAYATHGHSEKSQHYQGNAVDGYFQGIAMQIAVVEMELALKKLGIENKVGLGIYIDWNNPGFHLDIRGHKARWGRNKSGVYVAYDEVRKEIMLS